VESNTHNGVAAIRLADRHEGSKPLNLRLNAAVTLPLSS
jgi:hypothetical protein